MIDNVQVIVATILSIAMMSASCSREDINSTPADFSQISVICGDSAKVAGFVNNIYSNLPSGYNRLRGSSMVGASTDEAVHAVRGSAAEKWGTGSWGPTALFDDPFPNSYAAIRKTFIFEQEILPRVNRNVMTAFGQNLLWGQVLFLRALYNFELLKRFGGYPIVKSVLVSDQDLNIPRSTYDECVAYISDLCDQASSMLPVSYLEAQFGRATKGAALALKARLLLYAASPLFNNPDASADGFEHGSYDPQKWENAAKAAFEVINLKDGASPVYALFPDYETFFTTLAGNKEIIFSNIEGASNRIERLNGPVSITDAEGGTNPSLELVDAYEMADGTPFSWDNPVQANHPFDGRDPRFYSSILYNGATWMNKMTIEAFENGKDKVGNKATRTSFYLRKFLSINARWNAPIGNAYHCFPLFRYGEVLLNYAEAMNEVYGPDQTPVAFGMTSRQAVALIRKRAGLTGNVDLSRDVPKGDKSKMREAIRHERRIELAFEEHRHLDLRRWKTAQQVLNRPVHGLIILKRTDNSFVYKKVEVENRVFDSKMYLYPFPQAEMNRNSNLVQNTGW